MTRIKRPIAATGAAVLLALSLSACGGGAPTDASKEDFCDVVTNPDIAEDVDPEDYDAQAEALQGYADDLEEVGTPEEIDEDARAGFELIVDQLGNISASDLEDASGEGADAENPFGLDISDDEQKQVEAFSEYTSSCSE